MLRKSALAWACRRNLYEVRKGCVFGRAAKGTGAKPPEILNNAPGAWLSEQKPRLKACAWNYGQIPVLFVSEFRTITASKCLYHADYLPTSLETGHAERLGHKMRNQALG
jgi:hypothetical protein